MVDIPEHLLQRSAEARAKALGISIEQAMAEMKGQSDPTIISKEPEVKVIDETPAPAAETPAPAAETPAPAAETPAPAAETPAPAAETITPIKEEHAAETTEKVAAVKIEEKSPAAKTPPPAELDTPDEVDFAPEVKVTQRLLTVVKAKPIQKPAKEPIDKVNTWPHLMLPEFVALMAMTAFSNIFISNFTSTFVWRRLIQT
jgi:hypothetical protein